MNYKRSRYYSPSTSSRLIDSQEAHGRTQKELEEAKKRILELESILSELFERIAEIDFSSILEEENE
jgi:hypothetical protein